MAVPAPGVNDADGGMSPGKSQYNHIQIIEHKQVNDIPNKQIFKGCHASATKGDVEKTVVDSTSVT